MGQQVVAIGELELDVDDDGIGDFWDDALEFVDPLNLRENVPAVVDVVRETVAEYTDPLVPATWSEEDVLDLVTPAPTANKPVTPAQNKAAEKIISDDEWKRAMQPTPAPGPPAPGPGPGPSPGPSPAPLAKKSNAAAWIIGSIAVVGAGAVTIYFITRKKGRR